MFCWRYLIGCDFPQKHQRRRFTPDRLSDEMRVSICTSYSNGDDTGGLDCRDLFKGAGILAGFGVSILFSWILNVFFLDVLWPALHFSCFTATQWWYSLCALPVILSQSQWIRAMHWDVMHCDIYRRHCSPNNWCSSIYMFKHLLFTVNCGRLCSRAYRMGSRTNCMVQ